MMRQDAKIQSIVCRRTGSLGWKFAQSVGPAHLGAVTHPGAAAETHVYADI